MTSPLPSQNLLRPVPSEISKPAGHYKAMAFDAVAFLAALAAGFQFRRFLEGGASFFVLASGFIVYLIASSLGSLLTQSFGHRALGIFLQMLALAVFLVDQNLLALGLGGGVAFICFLWGDWLARREMENSLYIRYWSITRAYLRKAMTGLAFFLILFYPPIFDAQKNPLSPEIFSGMFGGVREIVQRMVPEIDLNAPVGAIAKDIAQAQLEKDPQFAALPLQEQEQYIVKGGEELVRQLEEMVRAPVTANQSLGEIVYQFVSVFLGEWRKQFGNGFLFALGLLVFLAVRSVGSIVNLIAGILGWFAFQTLLATNVVHIVTASRSQEVIEYS